MLLEYSNIALYPLKVGFITNKTFALDYIVRNLGITFEDLDFNSLKQQKLITRRFSESKNKSTIINCYVVS